jgi:hypothetical protein
MPGRQSRAAYMYRPGDWRGITAASTLRRMPNDLAGRLRPVDISLGRKPAADDASWAPLLAVGLSYFIVILDAKLLL